MRKTCRGSKVRVLIICHGYLHLGSMPVAQKRRNKMENARVTGSAVDSFAIFHGLGKV